MEQPPLELVLQALDALYRNEDPAGKEKASQWLMQFQASVGILIRARHISGTCGIGMLCGMLCMYRRECVLEYRCTTRQSYKFPPLVTQGLVTPIYTCDHTS